MFFSLNTTPYIVHSFSGDYHYCSMYAYSDVFVREREREKTWSYSNNNKKWSFLFRLIV
jgi:hypothetical protein